MEGKLTTKTAVTRLLEQAGIPESEKLKTDEVVAMMGNCMGAIASEDVDNTDQHIAMAKHMRTPEGIRKSKADTDKWADRGVVELWLRIEALKLAGAKSRYDICGYAN